MTHTSVNISYSSAYTSEITVIVPIIIKVFHPKQPISGDKSLFLGWHGRAVSCESIRMEVFVFVNVFVAMHYITQFCQSFL